MVLVEYNSLEFIFVDVISVVVLLFMVFSVSNRIFVVFCKIPLKQVRHYVVASLSTSVQSLIIDPGVLVQYFNVVVYCCNVFVQTREVLLHV